ncbi:ABC transporter permease [Fusibacter sp. 3D3]|uniref:ABC transporter permease n=1 Tax=Fusibacter sp. 3D3 TaxID=1048380 RepID=UPI0008539E40|nr:ABC transporter permease [Fusibacter sp. 3D3]
MFIKSIKATFIRDWITQLRAYPMHFFIGNVLTVFYTVLGAFFMYHLLFQGHLKESFEVYTGTTDYMTYVIIGSLAYALVVRTLLNVSRSLVTELRQGTLESLMLAPFSRLGYFIGNMLQQMITSLGEVFLSMIFCFIFGLSLSSINGVTFVVSLVITLYAYFGLSLCLGAVMLYTRDTYISQNTLFLFIFLVSGVIFPVEYLPQSLNIIGACLPVRDSIFALRAAVMNGVSIESLYTTYVRLFLLGTGYFIVGYSAIRKIERIALEKIFG